MQPYLFPYLGYYQLVHHVDEFVLFDDVNFIKKGYINRNNIVLDGAAHRFTLPVLAVSQNRRINDHLFTDSSEELVSLIDRAYRKSAFFDDAFPVIADTLNSGDRNVAVLAGQSIKNVFSYLGVDKKFSWSSAVQKSPDAKGEQKILEICQEKRAERYTNAIGGKDLYNSAAFAAKGIELEFIKMRPVEYSQGRPEFIPNLSMIDVLMNCSKDHIKDLLGHYDIEKVDGVAS